jgi:CRISPR-associated Csx2 family protein
MKQRKVFISFLGTSPYSGSRYIGEDPKVDRSTRFVQVATLESVADQFGEDDQVYIFTTKESLKNWDDQPVKGSPESVDQKLKSEILELNIGCNIDNVMVPDGKSQDEVWDIFTIIFDKLAPHDNLFFDITHGFRSLPLLALPLINYAKLLKSVTVSGIFYGAYDRNVWKSSVWNLTDFSKLQDWTNNANIFLETGNAKGLAKQLEGGDYQDVKEGLERFSEFTLVNRGMDIYKGEEIIKLSLSLNTIVASEKPADKVAKPIFDKVRDTFKLYKENSAINGFHAARWCIQNGLIQQATTLLEEFLTSYVVEAIGEKKYLQHEDFRTFVSGVLSVRKENFIFPEKKSLNDINLSSIAEKVYDLEDYGKLQKLANQIKQSIRNDINHAGFRSAPRDFSGLSKSIVKRYNELSNLLEKRGYELTKL